MSTKDDARLVTLYRAAATEIQIFGFLSGRPATHIRLNPMDAARVVEARGCPGARLETLLGCRVLTSETTELYKPEALRITVDPDPEPIGFLRPDA